MKYLPVIHLLYIHKFKRKVGKYPIHGAYGIGKVWRAVVQIASPQTEKTCHNYTMIVLTKRCSCCHGPPFC